MRAKTRRQRISLVDKLWRIFISLKLTFALLLVIIIGSVIGMSFDQTITFEQFFEQNGTDGLSKLLSFFELYDAFHSWWFSLAVLLLAANLIACSIERLPRIFLEHINPRPYLTKRRLLSLPFRYHFVVTNKQEAQKKIALFLGKKPKSKKLSKLNDSYYYESQGLSKFGVYIVHIALLIVMFSSVYTTQNGVDGHVLIEEGSKARFITARGPSGVSYTYDLGFYIGCNDFRLKTFIDNSPMEFESDLYVTDSQHKILKSKTVRVNEPLNFAGFTFYQSSFRPVISEKIVDIEIADDNGYKERYAVRLNTPIIMKDGSSFRVEKVYEDFAGLGQALRIWHKSKDEEESFFHIFRRYKDYDRVVRKGDFFLTFIESDQQYATGLSVGKVPGIEFIFGGFLLLLVGLYMCFFMTPIRFFARVIKKDEHCYHVFLAAWGFRNHKFVDTVFSKRLTLIEEDNA